MIGLKAFERSFCYGFKKMVAIIFCLYIYYLYINYLGFFSILEIEN